MTDARSPGWLELLRRNRAFSQLFWARTVSLFGDWFNTIAVLAVLDRIQGERAQAFGWVLILKLLPLFVLGPVAGVVADRLDRRRILVATDLLRAVVVLAFLLLAVWPRVRLLYALAVLQTSLSAFFEPARTAAVAQVCRSEELVPANALGSVTWSIMLTLGAAVGGLANHLFGWQAAIVIDAATYVVSALFVLPVRLPRLVLPQRTRGAWHALGLGDALDGFHYMRTHRDVATIVWAKCAWGLGGAITLMLTVFGQRVYPLGGSAVLGMAIFYAARGVGTALGPLAARRWVGGTPHAMGRAMEVSFPVAALFYLGFGSLHSLPLATLCVIGAHLGGAVIWVFSTVLLQASVPHAFQGRVFAAELGLFTLSFSISTGVYGRLADSPDADLFALVRSLGWIFLAGGALWSLARRRWPVTQLASVQAPDEREQDV